MRVFGQPSSRRAFFILWGSWTAVALLFAILYDLWHEGGLALACLIGFIALLALAAMEIRFRRRNLPREGRRPWHAILVLFVVLIPILVLIGGQRYGHYLPMSDVMRDECRLQIRRQATTDRRIDLAYQYDWEKSNWGPTLRTRKYSETRIWKWGSPEKAWVLEPDLQQARPAAKTGEDEVIQLTAEGYEELYRRLGEDPLPEDQVTHGANLLRVWLGRRGARIGLSRGGDYQFMRTADSVDGGRPAMQPWLWIAAILFSLCLFPVTWMVVGTTMFPDLPPRERLRAGAPEAA